VGREVKKKKQGRRKGVLGTKKNRKDYWRHEMYRNPTQEERGGGGLLAFKREKKTPNLTHDEIQEVGPE